VGRYPFGVELFHLLLHAGLSRRFHKIEHRLFSHISMNWRGRPLTSHDVIVNTIAATTTSTGLSVHAELDTGTYPSGIKIPDKQMKTLHEAGTLRRHDWHPEWNYTLEPPQKLSVSIIGRP
jgi:hypothetical protein